MSEFEEFYRIHDHSLEEVLDTLKSTFPDYQLNPDGDDYTLAPSATRLRQLRADAARDYDSRYFHIPIILRPRAPEGSVAFHTWLTSEPIGLTQVFVKQGWTFLTYGYHTGAGWDELQLFQGGKLRYVENYADQWTRFGEDSQTLASGTGTLQETALNALDTELGEARGLIAGWRRCVEGAKPLAWSLPSMYGGAGFEGNGDG